MTIALQDWETFTGTNTPVVGATVNARTASTTHPNAGAVVASTTTASNGQWAFAALADGTYDIDITYNGRVRHRKGLSKFSNAISGSNFATQVMNRLFAGPTSGADATPTFRAMVTADVPDGILTAPKFANQNANAVYSGPASGAAAAPTFRQLVRNDMGYIAAIGTRGTNQTIATATVTDLSWTSERTDTDGIITPTSTDFTVPTGQGGLWMVTVGIEWASNATGVRAVGILRAGTAEAWDARPGLSGLSTRQTVTWLGVASAGNVFKAQVYQDSGGNLDVVATANYSPWMAVARL